MATDLLGGVLAAAGLSDSPLRIMNRTKNVRVATSIKVQSVTFRYSSVVMRHMLEDGQTTADARVILPTAVEIRVLCPTIDAISQVMAIMADRESIYSVSSRGIILESVMLSAAHHSQTPENMSSAPISLVFQNVLLEAELQAITAQAGDASPVDRGIAGLSKVAAGVTSAVTGAVSGAVAGALGPLASPLSGALASAVNMAPGGNITGAIGNAIQNVVKQTSPSLYNAVSLANKVMGSGGHEAIVSSVLKRII